MKHFKIMNGGEKIMAKKPWLAAVLNIILSGLGYLYVGKRKVFGTLILVGELLAYVWIFTDPAALQLMSNMWVILGSLLWIVGLAIDAYNDAKEF
ncbi:MAG: hypothetical protein E4G94_12575 [ANME-2 cluster archaeon]|nr:MAG: hypothetical protein E4G94_12575 [ANME-2 cluster archaeon]